MADNINLSIKQAMIVKQKSWLVLYCFMIYALYTSYTFVYDKETVCGETRYIQKKMHAMSLC